MAGAGGSEAVYYNVRQFGCTNCGRYVDKHEECWIWWQDETDYYHYRPREGWKYWERWCVKCFWAKAFLDEMWEEVHTKEDTAAAAAAVEAAAKQLREARRFQTGLGPLNRLNYHDPRRGKNDG